MGLKIDCFTVGIDVGSRTTKAVMLNGSKIIGKIIKPTEWDSAACSANVIREIVQQAASNTNETIDISSVRIFSTGYGRESVAGSHKSLTEITCHARGAVYLYSEVETVIDIGGQDAKVISVDKSGFARDFIMNDRCAAGTGRFLEFMAISMGIPLSDFASLGLYMDNAARISSMCTVFAESEMLSLKAKGVSQENVIAGLHLAIARRLAAMAAHIGCGEPILFTGGVALNPSMIAALNEVLRTNLIIPDDPIIVGALGAAVLAQDLM